MKYYGALEAGGTKMVLSIFSENGEILDHKSVPTLKPEETMPVMIDYFKQHDLSALGIGCFGPLDLNETSPTFGCITATPKLAWRNYPIRQIFADVLGIPIGIDTDVNGAALAELQLGAAKGLESCVYITIGTGIGGGVVMGGKPVHGMMHPELGHQLVVPDRNDPTPEGFCPYHKHCLEGLAAGTALQKRWGVPGKELPQNHIAWVLEANYLAQMCHNAIMTISPQKIILGGGVMNQSFLLEMVRAKTIEFMGGYISSKEVENKLSDYIVAPGLGVDSGIIGAWLLGKAAE